MTFTDALEVATAVIFSLGGGGLLILSLSSWLGKVWAERILTKEKARYAQDLEEFKRELVLETESHKVRLKKSELLFAREFDAASALVALIRDISPRYRHPSMDWHEACDKIAENFGSIEKWVGAYLRAHGAVLNAKVRDILSSCLATAGEHQFEAYGGDVSREANAAAEKLYEQMKEAESALLEQVNSQVAR